MTDWNVPFENDDDSGIGARPGWGVKMWNETQSKKKGDEVQNLALSWTDFYAELIGRAISIARNQKNRAADRVAALEVARQTARDMANNLHWNSEQAENGERGMA